jgi:hypothetical protein
MQNFQIFGTAATAFVCLGTFLPMLRAQVFSSKEQAGVYVQGNGHGMAGTFDEDGFHGVYVGPDGQVQRIDGQDGPRSSSRSHRARRNGAFAAAGAGHTAIGPGGFDPFEFVFGRSGNKGTAATLFGNPSAGRVRTAAERAFRQGRYEDALKWAEQATLRGVAESDDLQLQALALFALGRFDEAGQLAREILADATPWDWPLLRSLYPRTATYMSQLKTLQTEARGNAATAGTHLLLAYHYRMLDEVSAARDQLRRVRTLRPDDDSVLDLLASLPPSVN